MGVTFLLEQLVRVSLGKSPEVNFTTWSHFSASLHNSLQPPKDEEYCNVPY
jgi:hypothetical protein